MASLAVEGLCKGWDFPVLDGISLDVAEGEFFVIVGPSGAGKTTLLRLIAGLEAPDAGTVRFGARDVTHVPPYLRKAAMTFESYALYPHLSVFENIASPLRARRLPQAEIDRKVRDVAQLLRIEQLLRRKPGEVSGGQKQRTALGRTLVADPEVFLLDEPISHLDAKIRHNLREQFHTLEELRRVASVYVTHDSVDALSLGDRVGVLNESKLMQVGPPREIYERPATLEVARSLGQPAINEIQVQLVEEGGELTARADGLAIRVADAQAAALRGCGATAAVACLRPQHVRLDGGESGIQARVAGFQALGAVGVLHAEAGGVQLRAITEPEATFAVDAPCRLLLAAEETVWFDAASGRNLLARAAGEGKQWRGSS